MTNLILNDSHDAKSNPNDAYEKHLVRFGLEPEKLELQPTR